MFIFCEVLVIFIEILSGGGSFSTIFWPWFYVMYVCCTFCFVCIRYILFCFSLQATTTLTTNDIVINKLTQILSYLRQGRRESKKLKKKEKGGCTLLLILEEGERWVYSAPHTRKRERWVYSTPHTRRRRKVGVLCSSYQKKEKGGCTLLLILEEGERWVYSAPRTRRRRKVGVLCSSYKKKEKGGCTLLLRLCGLQVKSCNILCMDRFCLQS